MNRTIGMVGSLVTALAVLCFAVCMLIQFNFGSYFVCMLLAFGFLMMIAAFHAECTVQNKVAGNLAMAFAGIYTVLVLLVYFAQTTAVRLDPLSSDALQLLDYQQFGLFFSYDLLGYGMMALATFFIGLTISVRSKRDRVLKALLLIHGVFFVSCFIMPMLGIFSGTDGSDWTGILVLEVWCIYFLPVAVLSYLHFRTALD